MAHADNEVLINQPVKAIFDYLADGLNNPKWRPPVISTSLKSGQSAKEGAEYNQTLKGPLGMNMKSAYQLTQVVPDSKITFLVTAGLARPAGEYLLTETSGGTSIVFNIDYQPKGLKKLLTPMIIQAMKAEVASLDVLKKVLEDA